MIFTGELELLNKTAKPANKAASHVSHLPTMEQLRLMTTNELVRFLMSPELAKPVNASLRQQVIRLLQEREGNAFVERLLGKTSRRTTR